jgi:hypothetical protein
MPAETPRATLFKDRARKFRILAEDSKGPTLDYLVLAAAYEALAGEAGQGEATVKEPKSVADVAA